MTDSWYQRALSRARGGPAAPQQQPQPRYQPSPGLARWQGDTQVSPQVQYAPAPQEKQQQVSVSDLLHNQQVTGRATPGVGHRLNPDPCPSCGGQLFYDTLGPKRRGPPPAPHCFNCGYNGLFEQGLEGNWIAANGG